MCFLSLYSSLFTILLYLFAAILKAGSAIDIQQFCNLMQNICNWKSIFQSNYKKIATIHHINHWLQITTPTSSPATGLEPTTSGLPAQCLIHSSTKSLIEIHENLSILTNIRLLQFDTKYLQLEIYFSIQMQNICNWKSISQSKYKIIANLS